ncbi:hypothetical protein [Streptomyces monomycini]|uniref:hypothetical protein n=1 Tax=Streptomyces monomycini TaxID=371720 RepID=UPI000518736B|nr:hypothetical protein [Streptomyces monomycini]
MSASEAWTYANDARVSAENAGKDRDAARKAHDEAREQYKERERKETEAKRHDAQAQKEMNELLALEEQMRFLLANEDDTSIWEKYLDDFQTGSDWAGYVPVLGEPFDGFNCLVYGLRGMGWDASASCAGVLPVLGDIDKYAMRRKGRDGKP